MITKRRTGVEFIVANTDAQALRHSSTLNKLQLGESGLGAGAQNRKSVVRRRKKTANALPICF